MQMRTDNMDTTQVALLALSEEKKHMSQHADYFIDTYGYVEDRDSVTGKSPFTLWDEQRRALEEMHANRLNIILKARQLGLTWLALWYACWCMLHAIGYTVVALSRRDDDAKELIHRMVFMLENLPRWLIQQKGYQDPTWSGLMWSATAHEVTIHRVGAEDSRFVAMPSAKDSGRSFTASLIILDEWAFQQWAEEIWTSAYPTINRPSGGKVFGISTAKRGTLFERIWEKPQDFGFHRIFLSWRTDPRRTEEWYEQTKRALSVNKKYLQEYPSTPSEAFSGGDLQSFPEFDRSVHVCEPFDIPKHWRRWGAVDNGYNDPFSWLSFAVSEDGVVYVYQEYSRWRDSERIYYSDQARRYKEMITEYEQDIYGTVRPVIRLDYIVAGLDAWHTHVRDTSGKNLIDYYRDGGLDIGFIRAITDRVIRKATIHEYLRPIWIPEEGRYTAKLQIFDTCTYLIDILPKLTNDEKEPEKVEDNSDYDNPYDCLSYGLLNYHVEKSKPPKDDKTEIQRHKEALAQKNKRFYKRLT